MKLEEYAYSMTVRRLLIMASLPVLDGFFISFLVTGQWRDSGQALAFGLTAFSGGACVVAAMKLQGSFWARVAQTIAVYMLLALLILIATSLQPVLTEIIPTNLDLFTSIFLLGLGLYTTGLPWLKRLALWTGFEAAIKVMLVATLIRAITTSGIHWTLRLDAEMLPALVIAWSGGLALTISGVLLGQVVTEIANQRSLDWGAGCSLMLMGLRLLGLPLPSALILAPLVIGYLWLATPLVVRSIRPLFGTA